MFFNVFQSLIVLLYILDNETNFVIIISVFVGEEGGRWKRRGREGKRERGKEGGTEVRGERGSDKRKQIVSEIKKSGASKGGKVEGG